MNIITLLLRYDLHRWILVINTDHKFIFALIKVGGLRFIRHVYSAQLETSVRVGISFAYEIWSLLAAHGERSLFIGSFSKFMKNWRLIGSPTETNRRTTLKKTAARRFINAVLCEMWTTGVYKCVNVMHIPSLLGRVEQPVCTDDHIS